MPGFLIQMSSTAIYEAMSVAELNQAFHANYVLYLNALRIKADREILDELDKEMELILALMKRKLESRSGRSDQNWSWLKKVTPKG